MDNLTTKKTNFEFIEQDGIPMIKCHHCGQTFQRGLREQMEHIDGCDGSIIPYAEISGENARKFIDGWVEAMKTKTDRDENI